jgi:hypothetical protein
MISLLILSLKILQAISKKSYRRNLSYLNEFTIPKQRAKIFLQTKYLDVSIISLGNLASFNSLFIEPFLQF